MKRIVLLFVITMASLPETGCTRKGDGDPLLSLRSRKARMDGDWKITSGSGVYLYSLASNGLQPDEPWTYTGTTLAVTSGNIAPAQFTVTIHFGRDGSYTWTKKETNSVTGYVATITEKGHWSFKAGHDDTKRKEEIILNPEIFYPASGLFYFTDVKVYRLQTLRNNKIVLERTNELSGDQVATSTDPVTIESWTLEPFTN